MPTGKTIDFVGFFFRVAGKCGDKAAIESGQRAEFAGCL